MDAGAHFSRLAPWPKFHSRGYFCGLDFAGGVYFQRSTVALAVFIAFLPRFVSLDLALSCNECQQELFCAGLHLS